MGLSWCCKRKYEIEYIVHPGEPGYTDLNSSEDDKYRNRSSTPTPISTKQCINSPNSPNSPNIDLYPDKDYYPYFNSHTPSIDAVYVSDD